MRKRQMYISDFIFAGVAKSQKLENKTGDGQGFASEAHPPRRF